MAHMDITIAQAIISTPWMIRQDVRGRLELDKADAYKKFIVVVDDEPDVLTIVKKTLELNGFQVKEYQDPMEAAKSFENDSKECVAVISDIKMPRMNGFELARKIKKKRPGVIVILMSGFEINKSEFDKVMPHTIVDRFIAKPFKVAELFDILKPFTNN